MISVFSFSCSNPFSGHFCRRLRELLLLLDWLPYSLDSYDYLDMDENRISRRDDLYAKNLFLHHLWFHPYFRVL
jgi:hypothetical protein